MIDNSGLEVKTVYEMTPGEEVRVKFNDGKIRKCYFGERIWKYGFWRIAGTQTEVVFGGIFRRHPSGKYYVLDQR